MPSERISALFVGPVEELARMAELLTEPANPQEFQIRTGMQLNINKCVPGDAEEQRWRVEVERLRLSELFPHRVHGLRGLQEPRTDEAARASKWAGRSKYFCQQEQLAIRTFPRITHPVLEEKAREFDALQQQSALEHVLGPLESAHQRAADVVFMPTHWDGRGYACSARLCHAQLLGAWALSHAHLRRRFAVIPNVSVFDPLQGPFESHERVPHVGSHVWRLPSDASCARESSKDGGRWSLPLLSLPLQLASAASLLQTAID
ncbi:MAG: hypothetical protein SGPRY_005600 [Prymnesium sp.]